ncbi:NAD-dependent epimerase/dehydratase family protein [Halostagnicola sp. A-GB9-2]|uniref:NAD-dependent epimerase/dehydratase family protein n=1 Tax=Halostagnicola sp. A-GB9-2 TaxID=3048066 RepID=UPI0024C08317|nr:NAD-dependent epimerase/dehydratase family protein [Halostagnicola sp. A-GB9-2]MDJ1433100.1 NAD-dependent epimerase/dehydratase family protein [Halostagnicola sp. A-GB9-2]
MQPEAVTDKTILITGGAGFIGSHLASTLVSDNDVRVLDNLSTGHRSNVPDGATFFEGTLLDEDTLAIASDGVDLIFHEAALVSVQRSVEDPLTSHEINTRGTLNLLEAARKADARVVLASSAAIYGQPEHVPISEGDPKSPTSPYGLDKLTIDHYARQYHDLYGLETVALRYFNAYGPGQTAGDYSGVISIFCDQAERNEPVTVHGDGKQTRDFVYIDDLVQANLRAATTDAVGTAYNIGTGTSVTVRELAEVIIEVTDSHSEVTHTDGRNGDIRHSEADITAARTDLEYEPSVSLREGLKRTAEWIRKE